LALHSQNIKVQIYELRTPDQKTNGGLNLAPNALRVLDRLGVYELLDQNSSQMSSICFRGLHGELVDALHLSREEYGYPNIRLTRSRLVQILREAVMQRNIPIHYGKTFSHFTENNTSVTATFKDGTTVRADILVGADGVYSTVRGILYPAVQPIYSGQSVVYAPIWDEEDQTGLRTAEPVANLYASAYGGLMTVPQTPAGSEIGIIRQFPYPAHSHAEMRALNADKDKMHELMMANKDKWPSAIQAGLDKIKKEDLFVWAFNMLPDLPSWRSPSDRVILIGDAAHAIPPAAAQGACQAVVDAWKLARTLAQVEKGQTGLEDGLGSWQIEGMARVGIARLFTLKLMNLRMPDTERAKLPPEQVWQPHDKERFTLLFGRGRAGEPGATD
jgi:2-polyprenyl-6-methoxyphenol hydroxylase-like FAD-dependent oxidoreductase